MQQTNTWLSFKKSFFLIKTFSSTGQADWWRTNYGENACTKTCSSPMIALLWWQIGQRGNTGMTLDDKVVILSKHGNNSHAADSSYATSGAFSPSSLGRPTILPDKNINIGQWTGQSWVMHSSSMDVQLVQNASPNLISSFYTPLPFTCVLLQLTCISRPRCKPAGQWRALPLLPPSHRQSLQSGGTLVT